MLSVAYSRIAEASRLLLEKGFSPETVTHALELVGRAIGVDRVYIFERDRKAPAGQMVMSQRFEWSGDAAAPQLDNPELQGVPLHELAPGWVKPFEAGQPVAGTVEEMDGATQELLRAQQIQSLLVCPIVLNNECWGFVGFDDCHQPRRWPAEEVAVLRTLARALAGTLRHTQMRSSLAQVQSSLQDVINRCGPGARA